MDPSTLGKKYDKIAQWWHNRHKESAYGVEQVKRALTFASGGSLALDVGCGAGGRMIRLLEEGGFLITGLDVSEKMIKLATENHPEHTFIQQDICDWQTEQKFDFIVAWDSLFHLPLAMQEAVVSKLCSVLKQGGVLIYSFGDACGEHTDQWQGDSKCCLTMGYLYCT